MSTIYGVDSFAPVTHVNKRSKLLLPELCRKTFGGYPAFWGRYFTSPAYKGAGEYRHALEDATLWARGIRVLPIARQTKRVGGTAAQGRTDGRANGLDLLATFGETHMAAMPAVLVFLDVEYSAKDPNLSPEYYAGWVAGLEGVSTRVTFRPALYCSRGATTTWRALEHAVSSDGVPCHGAWVAAYPNNLPASPLPAWRAANDRPGGIKAFPVRTLLWQYKGGYQGGGGVDLNRVNPAIDAQADLLNFLVLPPEAR